MNFRIAIDCIILAYDPEQHTIKILLVQRNKPPLLNHWVLPGGFVKKVESFQDTASEILKKETGISETYLRQLKAYSLTDPNPNDRIASIAYYALIQKEATDFPNQQQGASWIDIQAAPNLAFDHNQKVEDTLDLIRKEVRNEPIVYRLLPKKFTLNDIQNFYETLYEIKLDNRNFRRKLKKLPYLKKLNELENNVSHRPAQLYSFSEDSYLAYLEI